MDGVSTSAGNQPPAQRAVGSIVTATLLATVGGALGYFASSPLSSGKLRAAITVLSAAGGVGIEIARSSLLANKTRSPDSQEPTTVQIEAAQSNGGQSPSITSSTVNEVALVIGQDSNEILQAYILPVGAPLETKLIDETERSRLAGLLTDEQGQSLAFAEGDFFVPFALKPTSGAQLPTDLSSALQPLGTDPLLLPSTLFMRRNSQGTVEINDNLSKTGICRFHCNDRLIELRFQTMLGKYNANLAGEAPVVPWIDRLKREFDSGASHNYLVQENSFSEQRTLTLTDMHRLVPLTDGDQGSVSGQLKPASYAVEITVVKNILNQGEQCPPMDIIFREVEPGKVKYKVTIDVPEGLEDPGQIETYVSESACYFCFNPSEEKSVERYFRFVGEKLDINQPVAYSLANKLLSLNFSVLPLSA